jgi:transcriptional regulator with XRE-family HTH domain
MKNNYSTNEKKFIKKVGNNIRLYRLKLHISQEDLATKCNLDRSFMGSIERGEKNVSLLKLRKIAKTLGIELTTLLNVK